MNATIIRLGLRSVFGRRRGVLLFILPLVLIGLAVLVRVLVGADHDSAEDTLDSLGLAVIVPLIALLATTGLLAPEIDDGSISYLLAKPISRHSIVVSKLRRRGRLRARVRRGADAGRRAGPAHRRAGARRSASPSARSSAGSRTARCSSCCR